MRHLPACCCLLIATAAWTAQEDPSGDPAPGAEEAKAEPSPWSHKLKIGAFVQNVATHDAETSRDPTIAGSESSFSYQFAFDGKLTWKVDPSEFSNELKLRFGKTKQDGEPWVESKDQILYRGEYLRFLDEHDVQFLYGRWQVETVFTGPDRTRERFDPEFLDLYRTQISATGAAVLDLFENEVPARTHPFDPATALAAAGYGNRYQDLLLPEEDRLEWRLGVRAQKKWGRDLPDAEEELLVGPEFIAEYRNDITEDAYWYVRYEAFAPFDDITRVQNLVEAELEIQVTKYLTVKLAARGYYESHPEDVTPGPGDGYDEWSWRQESLIGVTIKL